MSKDVYEATLQRVALERDSWRTAFFNLINEISEPVWDDERMSYVNVQIDKKALAEARALATPMSQRLTQAVESRED